VTDNIPDHGDARAAVLRERAIFDAMPAQTEQLGHRPGMMVQALENRFHWIDRPEAAWATRSLARDIADVAANGFPQVVGTYDPENPPVFRRQ
jgi:hypothetical protein